MRVCACVRVCVTIAFSCERTGLPFNGCCIGHMHQIHNTCVLALVSVLHMWHARGNVPFVLDLVYCIQPNLISLQTLEILLEYKPSLASLTKVSRFFSEKSNGSHCIALLSHEFLQLSSRRSSALNTFAPLLLGICCLKIIIYSINASHLSSMLQLSLFF